MIAAIEGMWEDDCSYRGYVGSVVGGAEKDRYTAGGDNAWSTPLSFHACGSLEDLPGMHPRMDGEFIGLVTLIQHEARGKQHVIAEELRVERYVFRNERKTQRRSRQSRCVEIDV